MSADDPLLELEALGVTIAWAADMAWSVVWFPAERIAVLNARVPRQYLREALGEYLPEVATGFEEWA